MMKTIRALVLSVLFLGLGSALAGDSPRTGLIVPSSTELADFEAKYPMPVPAASVPLPSRVVNSTYLPPVESGNQGQLGICGSICITYFTATHQLAKARGWTAPGHDGDWSRVTSPAWGVWSYSHNTKNGAPWGANPLITVEEIIRSGIRSWEDYPYSGSALDYTYVPDFNERAAALNWRASTAVAIRDINSPSGIRSLKYFLAQGNIAATSTGYVETLENYSGSNVAPNGVVLETGPSQIPGHALTIVGYDDTIPYTDPKTGAAKQGAFLVVNSWGADWGYSVPEVGSGGFLWIPYDLPFLSGAYSLNFPAEDTVPELIAKYAVVDDDGDWTSSSVPTTTWLSICDLDPSDPARISMEAPVMNGYAAATNRFSRAVDAGDLFSADYPAVTFTLRSSAGVDAPEGEIEFSLYEQPDDQTPALVETNVAVWGYFPYQRKVTLSPLAERASDLGIQIKYGGLAAADLNGDGAEEFVAAYLEGIAEGGINSGDPVFAIARNDGAGGFALEALPGDGLHCGQPLLVDLDNDGDLDLVHSSREQTDLLVNNGSGSFSLSPDTLPAGGIGGAASADFDGDGRPDLLLANMDEGLLLMRQLPDGQFEKRPLGRSTPDPVAALSVDTTCVDAGDVNGDGLPDFVFWEKTREGYSPEKLVLGINQGGLELSFRILPTPDSLQSVSFALSDFDNDGCDDLAWSGCSYPDGTTLYRESHFGVLRGSVDGWMSAVPMAPDLAPICGGGISWADLDNDGALELLMTGRESDSTLSDPTLEQAGQGVYRNHFYLLRYDHGYFVERGFNLTGVTGSHRGGLLAPLDLDGDGDLDLISSGYRGPMSSSSGSDINEDLYVTALYENSFDTFPFSQSTNTAPTAPTAFSATPSDNQVRFEWSGALDAETASDGLRYQLQVGTSSGVYDLMSGTLDVQNQGLLQKSGAVLRDVPAGTLRWRVRTIDSAAAVSPWSAEQAVSVSTSFARSRVRIAAAEGGTSSPTPGEHLLVSGGSLLLTADPAAGWQFDSWLVNGASVADNPYSLTPAQQWVDVVPQFSEKEGSAPEVGEWSRQIVPYDSWNTFGFTDFAAVSLNGHLYCFPGYGSSSDTWRTGDGQTWTRESLMGGMIFPYADAVAWNNAIWLVADDAVYSATQSGTGALSWSTKTTSAPWGSTPVEVAVFNGKLWAINGYDSASSGSVWSSADGVSWTAEASAPWPNYPYKRLVAAGDKLLAIISTSSFGSDPGEVWASADGVSWTQQCAATPWEHSGSSWLSDCFIAATWFDGAVHVVGMENTHFVSIDQGVSWVKVHPTGSESSHFTAASAVGCELIEYDGDLVLIGNEEDDVNWTGSYFWTLSASSGGGSAYTLNISVSGEGGSTLPTAGAWFDEAGSYPVEARPEPGYEFVSWSGPVDDPASAATRVKLDSNVVVVATFRELDNDVAEPESVPFTASVSPAGSGRVERADQSGQLAVEVLADGSTAVTAVPGEGWEFSHWLGDSAKEMLSATTAVIPAGAASVELTACFRAARPARVLARDDSSGFVDAAGRQWLWGANRFLVPEFMWNSPDGGVPPFAFGHIDFRDGLSITQTLGPDGSYRQADELRFLDYRFVQLSPGALYTLAIDGQGRVWSWGSNAYGQLGDGTLTDRDEPVAVQLPESETFVQVSAGDTFGMALALSGKVYVWGANSFGQTGPDGLLNPVPVEMGGLPAVQDIAAGACHALALGSDGLVYGWGENTVGQSAGRRGENLDTPAAVENVSADMDSHRVVIDVCDASGNRLGAGGGSVVPYGQYDVRAYAEFFVEAAAGDRYRFDHWQGPVVDPDLQKSSAKAMPNAQLTAVFALNAEAFPTLDLTMSHADAAIISPATGTTAFAWGEAVELSTQPYTGWQFDHWMIDGVTNLNATVPLVMNRDVTAEAVYSTQTYRTETVPGLLNSWGQPANYDWLNRSIVDANYAGPLFADVAGTLWNGYSWLYLGADGTVWYVDSVPDSMARVPGETADLPYFSGVRQVVSSYGGFMLAVRQDNTVWVWGNVPGHADPVERPVEVSGLNADDWSQIVALSGTLFFVNTDGTVSSWGLDTAITGTGSEHSSLTTIPGLTGVEQLWVNSYSVLARKGDGTVWGWGNNAGELLGVSWDTLDSSATPVQVPGLSDITTLFAGGFARDGQGRTWVWGSDSGGDKGLGIAYANQSILPPMLHPAFPSNAVSVSWAGDGYTSVLCDDGSVWRAGNAQYWDFNRLNTEYLIEDTYEQVPVHQLLNVIVDPTAADWISHGAGTHSTMTGDRVLLWADPPVTVQCDGWLIDGLLVESCSINLLMDRDHTAEPVFSPRSKTELPAPELRIAAVEADISRLSASVDVPIVLSGQDYIIPDALQFSVQVPTNLPVPVLTVPEEWQDGVELITETSIETNGTLLKVLMLGTNDLFAVSNMTPAILQFSLEDAVEGVFDLRLLDVSPAIPAVAGEDDGAVAIPLQTTDGALRFYRGDQCAMKLHLTPEPTTVRSLSDEDMQAMTELDSLRSDLSRYAEVWVRCDEADELYACSYDLSISGAASFSTNQQMFINEEDFALEGAASGQSLSGMGGPIADEKIISYNDFADQPYESGDWMLVARLPLEGGGGVSMLSMTNLHVDLFGADGVTTFALPDQAVELTVAPNAAPTSSNLTVRTVSDAFVRIPPAIHDVNPQDVEDIALVILRHPAAGRVLVDPQDPHGFIYHPPENGIFSGTVSFEFALSDGTDLSERYTAEVIVNNPPRFVGLPDVVGCGTDSNVTVSVSVLDADTPADQLVFALHNAPHWLSISNNGDGSALISGVVPPTRDPWQVFAVQVSDPLSRETSQATLLLTFDPVEGGVLLTVIDGSGSGLFEEGAVLPIAARAPDAGEQFAGWDGDVQCLDDPQSMTPSVTLPDHDITLMAVYAAASPSDRFADWADSYLLADGQDGLADMPAGDRISNLEKYALGLIPTQAYRPGELYSMRVDAASQRLILRYETSKQAADVQITPIWSVSLSAPLWSSSLLETAQVGETDTHQIWEVSLSADQASGYLRLRFEF